MKCNIPLGKSSTIIAICNSPNHYAWLSRQSSLLHTQIRSMLLMSILGCCLAFGWALTVAVFTFSHPHGITHQPWQWGPRVRLYCSWRRSWAFSGPYSSQTLPESTLVQLAWFPNLSQANGGWLWTCPFRLGTVSTMASLASWHLSHTHHVGNSLILTCGWCSAAVYPAPWSAGEDGLEAGLLHLQDHTLSGDFMGEKCICGSSSAIWVKIRTENFHCGCRYDFWAFHRAGIQDQSRATDDFLFSGPPATDIAARLHFGHNYWHRGIWVAVTSR